MYFCKQLILSINNEVIKYRGIFREGEGILVTYSDFEAKCFLIASPIVFYLNSAHLIVSSGISSVIFITSNFYLYLFLSLLWTNIKTVFMWRVYFVCKTYAKNK